MEILNESSLNLDSFSFLSNFFKSRLTNTTIKYDEFKAMISKFTKELM